jgi:hypothetical protein
MPAFRNKTVLSAPPTEVVFNLACAERITRSGASDDLIFRFADLNQASVLERLPVLKIGKTNAGLPVLMSYKGLLHRRKRRSRREWNNMGD